QCRICRDPRRDPSLLCIVEEPKDVVAIERTREFRGRYHVLGGAINPIDGIGPDDLRIRELMSRLADGEVKETIIATDPNVEGAAPATHRARMRTPMGITVSRLASGLPVGGDLEYADEVTLGRAFEDEGASMPDSPDSPDNSDGPDNTELDTDLLALGTAVAASAEHYLETTQKVASGDNPDAAIPLLLLAVSDLSAVGARLGAIVDVVPARRFEPDDGPEFDVEPLRDSLMQVLDGVDEYYWVQDPVVGPAVSTESLSNDLTDVAQALAVGLRHHRAGNASEALWWWQFSYLSDWGESAASATRVL